MTSPAELPELLEFLRSGATDDDVLAWDAAADSNYREATVEILKDHEVYFDQRQDPAVAIAGLVAGRTANEVGEIVRWCGDPGRRELVDAIVARRTQQWRDRMFKIATTDRFGSSWWLIRSLMRVGVQNEPGDLYLYKLMGGAPPGYSTEEGKRIVEFLRADPGLIDDEIFQLLSTEGVTRSLSTGRSAWLDAIEHLAVGDLRGRILDTAWDGLIADWRPVDQRPLLELVKRLEPTVEERVARLPGLQRMTTSDSAPIVVWALKQLTDMLAAGHLDADSLLAVRAPLTMRDKGTATAHLALLEKALRAQIGDPAAIARTAALALDHPHDVIRARAAKLVAKHAPDHVTTTTPVVPVVAEPLARPRAGAFPLLTDAEDFVELLIASMAQDLSGVEVEQLLAATPRFAFDLDAKARKAIAQARTRHARGARHSSFATWQLADAVGDAEPGVARPRVDPRVYSRDFEDFEDLRYAPALQQRFSHLVWAMKQANVFTGLATPSTIDGTIRLADLQDRFAASAGLGALRVDIATAALRLDPADYAAAEATIAAGKLGDPEICETFHRDLRRIRDHHPAWNLTRYTASVGLAVSHYDWVTARHGRRGMAVVQDESFRQPSEPDVLAALLDRRNLAGSQRASSEMSPDWRAPIRSQAELLSLTLPHHREHYAAHVLGAIRAGIGYDYGDPDTPFILELGKGPTPTGAATTFALASATTLFHAENRAAVVDALIERATYGELDGPALGRALRDLIENDQAIPQRIANAISEAGSALGPLSEPILEAIVQLLPLMRRLKDGHAFVASLADLATGLGRTIELPAELAELNEGRATTALARAVRRVPVG